MTSHTPQPPAGDDLVARLREEAEFLSGLSLNHGRADYGVSANLANEAADFIEALTQHTEPVAGEVEVVAWLRLADDGSLVDLTHSRMVASAWKELGKHVEPLVTKPSYDALAAAKDTWEWAVRAKDRQILEIHDALEYAERQRDALRESLRQMSCPRPCNGRPDDFTVGQCIDAGECGCIAHVAARRAEEK